MFWRIFFQLIRRDMVIFRKEYPGKMIDMFISFIAWVIALGYFMPTEPGFNIFIMVGAIASFGIFEIIGQATAVITDIKGDRTISYLVLLPIRSSAVFWYMATSWALQTLGMTIPLFFVGKLIFWKSFVLSDITVYQLILALITVNLFFGTFALWIAGALVNVRDITRLYFRFLNPLFIFGCYFFSWHMANKLSAPFSYVLLFNPFSYVMEIFRTAVIGQQDFLPFWWSFFALWGFIALCSTHAIKRLKKELDCI